MSCLEVSVGGNCGNRNRLQAKVCVRKFHPAPSVCMELFISASCLGSPFIFHFQYHHYKHYILRKESPTPDNQDLLPVIHTVNSGSSKYTSSQNQKFISSIQNESPLGSSCLLVLCKVLCMYVLQYRVQHETITSFQSIYIN